MSDTNGTPDPASPEGGHPRYAPPVTPQAGAPEDAAAPGAGQSELSRAPEQQAQPQYAPPQYAAPQYAAPTDAPPEYAAPYAAAQGSPYAPTHPPKRGLSTGAIVGIVLGAVALLTAIMLVIGFAFLGNVFRPSSPAPSTDADPQAAAAAVTAVEEYLAALADGDAETAKGLLGSTGDSPLLTDRVAKRSVELAPITNITVDPDPTTSYSSSDFAVESAFSVGGRTVERTFEVFGYSDGSVEIVDGTEMLMGYKAFEPFPTTVNGEPFPKSYATVFPGTYEIDLGHNAFVLEAEGGTITDTGTVVRLMNEDDSSALYTLSPKLTEESLQTFRSLVRKSLDECLAMTTATTPCGMNVPERIGELRDLGAPIEGTAKRSLAEDAEATLDALEPYMTVPDPLVLETLQYVAFDLTVEVNIDGTRSTEPVYSSLMFKPSVDFGAETLKVSWRE